MLVSMAFFGFVMGSFASAALGDYLGRRPLIFLHGGTFVPMSLFSAFSDSLPQLAVTRFFVGMSMGIVFPSLCSMMAEFTPRAWRARAIITIPGLAYSFGQVYMYIYMRTQLRKHPHAYTHTYTHIHTHIHTHTHTHTHT